MQKVYDALAHGEKAGIFRRKVKEGSGSWMNVVFEVIGADGEKKFLDGAEDRGMKGLKGHRSVGGIRVSLYNAIREEEVERLVEYMHQFASQHAAGST